MKRKRSKNIKIISFVEVFNFR
jgi:hypothetical protein